MCCTKNVNVTDGPETPVNTNPSERIRCITSINTFVKTEKELSYKRILK